MEEIFAVNEQTSPMSKPLTGRKSGHLLKMSTLFEAFMMKVKIKTQSRFILD